MKIIIIEDENLTAKNLSKTLNQIDPDIQVLTIINSVEEGLLFFSKNPEVDLIFSDIELGDGLSFEIFQNNKTIYPIIFCTAYNQYALNAFQLLGIDYILKPFNQQTIEKSLDKYHKLKEKLVPQTSNYEDIISLLKNNVGIQNQSILIHHGDKIIPLNIKEVALFYIEDDYTFAYAFDGKKHILSQNLDSFEKQFYPTFFRANRQFLINRKAVKDASHSFNRKLTVNLTIPFGEQINVGKLKVTAFTKWLSNS